MFRFAQAIARHKVLAIAAIGVGALIFSSNGKNDEGPSSPWAKSAPVQASSQTGKDSLTGKLGDYANTAGEYAAENILGDKDLNPVAMGQEAVGNFDKANGAFASANKK